MVKDGVQTNNISLEDQGLNTIHHPNLPPNMAFVVLVETDGYNHIANMKVQRNRLITVENLAFINVLLKKICAHRSVVSHFFCFLLFFSQVNKFILKFQLQKRLCSL